MGRRVRAPQIEVGSPRIALRTRPEALRQVDLVAVSGANMVLHARKRARISVAVEARLDRGQHAKRRARPARIPLHAVEQLGPSRPRLLIPAPRTGARP